MKRTAWWLIGAVGVFGACSGSSGSGSSTSSSGSSGSTGSSSTGSTGSTGSSSTSSSSSSSGSSSSSSGSTGTPDAGPPDAGPVDAGPYDAGPPPIDAGPLPDGGLHLRLMAGNLSSGNHQDYTGGEGLRLFEGMHPDVAMVQEFNYLTNSDADLLAFATSFGPDFTYARGVSVNIPNGVVSRYPIIEFGDWDDTQVSNRQFTWAHIDLPGPQDLWVISVHLLTSPSTARAIQADELIQVLNDNVPPDDLVVLGGDFNTGSRNEDCVVRLGERFVITAPYPAAQDGKTGTNVGRDKPYDWVLVSPSLDAYRVPVVIGAQQFDGGLVFDSRVYTPISDVAPALATDSAAPSMQHMGVVKDFLITR